MSVCHQSLLETQCGVRFPTDRVMVARKEETAQVNGGQVVWARASEWLTSVGAFPSEPKAKVMLSIFTFLAMLCLTGHWLQHSTLHRQFFPLVKRVSSFPAKVDAWRPSQRRQGWVGLVKIDGLLICPTRFLLLHRGVVL